jgi:16S rRNA G966 N2-methylase RsmD
MTDGDQGAPTYDRGLLLSDRRRNDLLDLWEVERYGRDSFGDPDYVRIYGMRPAEWYARGIRIPARTAVECTRDPLADLIARDVASVARTAPAVAGSAVVDPFAGSGNTLHWIRRRVGARSGVGFELDDAVFDATRRNLGLAGLEIELLHQDYRTGLRSLQIPPDQLVIVFVAPPWGNALNAASGLDLRRTHPPVGGIVDLIATTFPDHKLLVAVQVYEASDPDGLEDVVSRFDWSTLAVYGIDPPGRNHGLLLGTRGWSGATGPRGASPRSVRPP